MKRAIGASALVLALTACSGGGSGNMSNETGNVAGSNVAPSNAQRAVRDLPEGSRNGMLIRAIRDARQPCQHVQESSLSQTPGATPVYMATCENGAVYAVAIRDDGTALVQPAMPAEDRK